jgi:dimethylsulfoniopropionate demethylase
MAKGQKIGQITSAAWSPDFDCTVAIGMVRMTHWDPGTTLQIDTSEGTIEGVVQEKFWI